jgi:citrate synthase
MLKEIQRPERAEGWLREHLKSGERIMGFGHRLYRTTDPRAEILRTIAGKSAEKGFFELATQVEQTGVRILQEHRPGRKLYTNVEFYSSVVMDSVGLSSGLFSATFAVSRAVGWSANVLEQVADNRLIRPEIEYTGPMDKKIVPIQDR